MKSMIIKILACAFLAIGAIVCFGAEKIADRFFENKDEEAVLKIKAAAFVPVLLGMAILFLQ